MNARQRKRQRYASMASTQPGWGRAWPIYPDTSVRFQGRRWNDMSALLAEMEAAMQKLCGITPAMMGKPANNRAYGPTFAPAWVEEAAEIDPKAWTKMVVHSSGLTWEFDL